MPVEINAGDNFAALQMRYFLSWLSHSSILHAVCSVFCKGRYQTIMKRTLYILSFLLLLIGFSSVAAAQDRNKMLSVAEMHEDIDSLYSWLLQVHPKPDMVLKTAQWQCIIDSLKQTMNRPVSKATFFFALSDLNKYLDLHSQIYGSKKMRKQFGEKTFDLPHFCEDKGDVLLSMDSQFYRLSAVQVCIPEITGTRTTLATPQQIEQEFLQNDNLVEPSKNHNFRDALMSYLLRRTYVDTIVLLCQPIEQGGEQWPRTPIIPVKSSEQNSAPRHVSHDSIFLTLIPREVDKKQQKKTKLGRELHLVCDSTRHVALLEINTFMPSKNSFVKQLRAYVDSLRYNGIDTLFVDITRNRGGLVALEGRAAAMFVLGSNPSCNLIYKQSRLLMKNRMGVDLSYGDAKQGDYYEKPERMSSDNSNAATYQGKIYVVQSRHSYSAATLFATHMQEYAHATIVGEENQVKAMFANPLWLTLPNSKFNFICSSVMIRPVGRNKTSGVLPDIPFSMYNTDEELSIPQLLEVVEESEKQE